jgi:C4-dicarboxylate-specific signal transduction histidine kinase
MDDDGLGLRALQAGAEDYLVKGQVDTRLLVRAIRYAKERHAHIEDIRRLNDELKGSLDRKLGELRAAQEKSIRNERMAAIGTIAAGVAHELNSPLMGVLNHIQYAAASSRRTTRGCMMHYRERSSIRGGARASSRHCSMHARQDFPTGAALRITYGRVGEAVSVALRDARNLLEACRVRVEIDTAEPLPEVALDQSTLQLVLLNLIRNACHAMRHCASPTIWIGHGRPTAASRSRCATAARESMPRRSSRFSSRSTAPSRSGMGSGLGLALCKCLVENAGGCITADSERGKGTSFCSLTAHSGHGQRLAASHGRRASGELKRVLVIDDDDAVRSAFKLALERVNADIVTSRQRRSGHFRWSATARSIWCSWT